MTRADALRLVDLRGAGPWIKTDGKHRSCGPVCAPLPASSGTRERGHPGYDLVCAAGHTHGWCSAEDHAAVQDAAVEVRAEAETRLGRRQRR